MCYVQHTASGAMDTILTLFDACPNAGGVRDVCNDDYASSVYTQSSSMMSWLVTSTTLVADSWSYSQSDTLFFGYICTIRGQLQLIRKVYISSKR